MFYAAHGWDTEALNRAAVWTPAERMFFEAAMIEHRKYEFRLAMIAADNVVRSNIADEGFEKNYMSDRDAFLREYLRREYLRMEV